MKTVFIQMKWLLVALPIFVVVLLSGCSGGGSSGAAAPSAVKITGTAAAGAPVVGYVSVRDSSANLQPVKTNIPIEANGNYSVDVTGLTAPYAFLASGTVGGKTVSLYSAATSTDEGKTINITPFTDLMIRNIAAGMVDNYLANPANMAGLTTSQLDAQRVSLTAQLAPALAAMGVSGSIDLLRTSFNADSTGLDRFMDVVKVDTTTPSAVKITNILDAATQLTIDTTASTSAIAVTGTLPTTGMTTSPTIPTPLDSMQATAKAFSAFFATSLPSPSDPNLLALFSNSTFMNDGMGSSAFVTDITSSGTSVIGMSFINVVVDNVNLTTGIANMHFSPVNAAGQMLARDQAGGAITWQMKNVAGTWLMNGNQRIARVSVNTMASRSACNPANMPCNMTTTYHTGLNLEINNSAAQAIGSALVSGPGLPQAGVTLVPQLNQTWFTISSTNPDFPLCSGCTAGSEWQMTDTSIAAVLPDSVYTVTLNDLAGAPIAGATYTEKVPVAPTLSTAVSSLAYPSISGMMNLNSTSSITLTPSWNIPVGLVGDYLYVNMWQTGTNANLNVEANKLTTSTGIATLVINPPASGSWTSGSYGIGATNLYGGRVKSYYQ